MTLTTNEQEVLHQLLLAQLAAMRKTEKMGMMKKVQVYRQRIDALDKVLGYKGAVQSDEVGRVNVRLQEGRY